MSCGHIGYLVYLHNDEYCEKCYSRNTIDWDKEVKEPRKVLVKSELGLLGALEGKEMWLMETSYDIDTKTAYGVVKENALHHCKPHQVAMEHIQEIKKVIDTNSKALEVQVGGTHYKEQKIQPLEYIFANNLGFCEGNVIKYVTRYKYKNGLEDLKKAKHYLELLMEQYQNEDNSK